MPYSSVPFFHQWASCRRLQGRPDPTQVEPFFQGQVIGGQGVAGLLQGKQINQLDRVGVQVIGGLFRAMGAGPFKSVAVLLPAPLLLFVVAETFPQGGQVSRQFPSPSSLSTISAEASKTWAARSITRSLAPASSSFFHSSR